MFALGLDDLLLGVVDRGAWRKIGALLDFGLLDRDVFQAN